jgi:hypothetical protein
MIQIIPETRKLFIRSNPDSQDQFDSMVIAYIIYSGKDLKDAPYEADGETYVQTLSTLDAMEHIQAHAGVDAYMFLQNEEGHEERLS